MEFILSKLSAKITFFIMLISAGYYWIRLFVIRNPNNPLSKSLKQFLPFARKSHPYFGLAILPFLLIHSYIMLNYGHLNMKVIFGASCTVAMLLVMILGLLLWVDKSKLDIRKGHRYLMFLVVVTAVLHGIV